MMKITRKQLRQLIESVVNEARPGPRERKRAKSDNAQRALKAAENAFDELSSLRGIDPDDALVMQDNVKRDANELASKLVAAGADAKLADKVARMTEKIVQLKLQAWEEEGIAPDDDPTDYWHNKAVRKADNLYSSAWELIQSLK